MGCVDNTRFISQGAQYPRPVTACRCPRSILPIPANYLSVLPAVLGRYTSLVNKQRLVGTMYQVGSDCGSAVEAYTSMAAEYHISHDNETWQGPHKLAEIATEYLDHGAKILDFGAGSGLLGVKLQQSGFNTLDALEPSEGMVKLIPSGTYKALHLGFLGKDFKLQPPYDCIMSAGVIGTHVYTEELRPLLDLLGQNGILMYTIGREVNEGLEFQDFYRKCQQDGWMATILFGPVALNTDIPAVTHHIMAMWRRRRIQKSIKAADPVPEAGIEAATQLMTSGALYRYSATAESPVSLCELELAQYVGRRYCVALNSCGSAIYLMLLSAGVKPGDKVLTNAFTFIAVPSAIHHAGASPVYVATLKDTFHAASKCGQFVAIK